MKELQLSIVMLMVLMCSALILLMPGRVKRDKVSNRSRWLMVGSLGTDWHAVPHPVRHRAARHGCDAGGAGEPDTAAARLGTDEPRDTQPATAGSS